MEVERAQVQINQKMS